MNFRVRAAGEILNQLTISNVLDIGCRGCEAKHILPEGVDYFGNDLFQNEHGEVSYVGDALEVDFGRTFDCIIALDIVEHVDDPYVLMDKIISLSNKYVIISLPNTYSLRLKINFVLKSSLGSKYSFETSNRLDRHRWVMNYDEIIEFYSYFAKKYSMSLNTIDLKLGASSPKFSSKLASALLQPFLGKRNLTGTIVGVFSK
jgi:hypothetical protein